MSDADRDYGRTHFQDCYLFHHKCAVARVQQLQAEAAETERRFGDERVQLTVAANENGYKLLAMSEEVVALRARVAELESEVGRLTMERQQIRENAADIYAAIKRAEGSDDDEGEGRE